MAMIEFVRNYTDHSTDRGYQFEFRCDHCSNGYMSSYQASIIGTAGGLLQAAGSLFGGILGSAGNSSYEIQRAIGGPAHDRALQQAVAEVKEKFRRCQRCGNWVCAEICWNERAQQCTGCNPKYEQEVISMRTQAQISATNEQLSQKARGVDYVAGIDMNPDSQVRFSPPGANSSLSAPAQAPTFLGSLLGSSQPQAQSQAQPQAAGTTLTSSTSDWANVQAASSPVANCGSCGAALTGGKFCSSCGVPVAPAPKTCSACHHVSAPTARFCEECGGKLS